MLWTTAMGFTSHKVLNLLVNRDTAVVALMVKDSFLMTFGRLTSTSST